MTSALSGKGTKRKTSRLPIVLITISTLLILGAIGLFVLELVSFSQQEDRLPADVTVGGIPSGGLSAEEAVSLWQQTFATPITLYYENSPIILNPSEIGFRTNWETMLAQTQATGEQEGDFWVRFFNYLTGQTSEQSVEIPLFADYQQTLLRQFLEDVSRRYDRSSGDAGYDVTSLSTFSGASGQVLNIPEAITRIDTALRDPENRTVALPIGDASTARPGLDTLQELIIDYLDSQNFIYDGQTTVASIFIVDLVTGEELNILGDVAFSAASTIKVGILTDYYRYLDTEPTQEEAWLMANSLLCSRNSSSNLLMQISGGGVDIFSGLSNVVETMQYIGAENTYITAPFVEGVANQQLGSIQAPPTTPNPSYNTDPDPFNQTTAEDMGTIYNMIYDCATYGSGLIVAYPDGEFTQNECRQMMELMSANDLLRLLQGGLPADTYVSHKNGWLDDMVGDAGIVLPPNGNDYIISIFLWEQTESGFQNFERLWPLVEGISRATWNYFSPETPLLNPRTDLPPTAQDCEGNYLPPDAASVNLNDIDAWRTQ